MLYNNFKVTINALRINEPSCAVVSDFQLTRRSRTPACHSESKFKAGRNP